jgi:hypothetical protein
VPRALTVVPYPYERGLPAAPEQIAWWRGHDAAIRLAASLLVDACGVDIDPYDRDVLVTPTTLARHGIAATPVSVYLARAFAEEVVAGFAPDQFTISEQEIRDWLAQALVRLTPGG